jgi:hypothetical protein
LSIGARRLFDEKNNGDNKNLVTLPLELLCCIKGCPKKAGVLKTIKETLLQLLFWTLEGLV